MRNYLLILLSVAGAYGVLNAVLPVPADASANAKLTDAVATEMLPEAAQLVKVEYLLEKDTISQIDLAELASKAEIGKATYSRADVAGGYGAVAINAVSTVPNYAVSVVTSEVVARPAYSAIYQTGKLLYAHNTANLFGNLTNLGVGSIFTVSEGGTVTTYKVSDVKVFEKNPSNGFLQLNGKGDYMEILVKTAFYHDIALMTCAGTSYGNGDASHRLVVFGDRI